VTLGVAGRTNANASAAASGKFVAVTWGASTNAGVTDIYLSTSADDGVTFGAPLRVSDERSRASLSGEQPPRIALTPRSGTAPAITIVWTGKGTDGTRLFSSRSVDGGRTFTTPSILAATANARGNRGWESIAPTGDGGVAAVWLDHRDTAVEGGAADHAHHAHPAMQRQAAGGQRGDPVERAQLSKLWFGRLDDPARAKPVAAGVCYCCKTAIATGPRGEIDAAWRHVYPGGQRDIAFTVSKDGGRTFADPVRISADKWALDGCPENGPALAVDPQGRIHIAWPTLITESGREMLALFYSASTDGRTFSARQRIPTTTAAAYHPQIAVQRDGGVIVAWDELTNGTRRVRFARATAAARGGLDFSRVQLPGSDEGSYPTVVDTSAGPLAVWSRTRSPLIVVNLPELEHPR
jgi:hypothetical protein